MRALAELAAAVPGAEVDGDPATAIAAVVYDSREVTAGALFCCVPGQQVDGHAFAGEAVRAGAAALLVEHRLPVDVPQVVVPDARAALGPVAAELHGHPSRQLAVVGVTGTNGKTTVTHLVADVARAAGRRAEVLGTLSGARTTPEAPDLQAQLRRWLDEGVDTVAMEVSSHALDLGRVAATRFTVAVFTNLGQDHLDHHGSMAAYFQAKARLFEPGVAERAVVNLDDPHGRLLFDAAQVPTTGYRLADAAVTGADARGTAFRWRGEQVALPLAGAHNLSNALAAATAAVELGVEPAAIARGLSAAGAIPGRFEAVDRGQPFTVVVDYAHTPDALGAVLEAARQVASAAAGRGRVLVAFGAGGDRDPEKRAPMGEVASRLADEVVLTSDNPRSEDPLAILEQVRRGVAAGARARTRVEPDRRAAIALLLGEARPGDVVVIAGKGHETTQVVGDRVLPFDDRVVAAELLDAAGGTGAR